MAVDKGSSGSNKKDDYFQSKLTGWKETLVIFVDIIGFVAAIVVFVDLCFDGSSKIKYYLSDLGCATCISYVGLSIFLLAVIIDRVFRNKSKTHKLRLEDVSIVDSFFVEVDNVEPRLIEPKERPENYKFKKESIEKEKNRLKELGRDGWTEYEILQIQKMLVEFMSIDELRTSAHSVLAELKEYADDSSYLYDKEYFGKWKQRIDEAEKPIDEADKDKVNFPIKLDDSAERLRAEYKTLIEHVTDYQYSWSVGSEVMGSLKICTATAIPVLVIAGLVPEIHNLGSEQLSILNWGLLGVSGALTAVLLGLRKSDLVEVGNTEGKKELWRAVIGAALGFVSGVLMFSIIAGGLITHHGTIVPDLNSTKIEDIGLMVFWAIGAGFSFDMVFDRLRPSNDFS